jgi:hypothetical protein
MIAAADRWEDLLTYDRAGLLALRMLKRWLSHAQQDSLAMTPMSPSPLQ